MQGETADRILQTARTLISDLGYSAFSYADIAEAVQIRKTSIHHHFPTKASLVVAVLRSYREKLLQGTQFLTQEIVDPLARLHTYVQHWEGCIRDKSQPFCIAALLAAALPSLPEEVRFEVQQHFLELSGWIRETLEEGISKQTLKLQGTLKTRHKRSWRQSTAPCWPPEPLEPAMYSKPSPPSHYNVSPRESPSQHPHQMFKKHNN
ncbi:MAG: transcriptional regulator [Acidobacteriaceae bacterium]|nr:transcriptional regulator [Acidobacteriaceae bacterium]